MITIMNDSDKIIKQTRKLVHYTTLDKLEKILKSGILTSDFSSDTKKY